MPDHRLVACSRCTLRRRLAERVDLSQLVQHRFVASRTNGPQRLHAATRVGIPWSMQPVRSGEEKPERVRRHVLRGRPPPKPCFSRTVDPKNRATPAGHKTHKTRVPFEPRKRERAKTRRGATASPEVGQSLSTLPRAVIVPAILVVFRVFALSPFRGLFST